MIRVLQSLQRRLCLQQSTSTQRCRFGTRRLRRMREHLCGKQAGRSDFNLSPATHRETSCSRNQCCCSSCFMVFPCTDVFMFFSMLISFRSNPFYVSEADQDDFAAVNLVVQSQRVSNARTVCNRWPAGSIMTIPILWDTSHSTQSISSYIVGRLKRQESRRIRSKTWRRA